ncbi:MAG: O-antigen ligase family protein, partial [Planctomycetota bacterium]|nr:O-antigen ligase family protein [Planctomycetota bacterium]
MDRVEVEAKILVPAAVTVACLAPAAAGCQFGWGWPVLVMASLLLAFCLCMRKALAGEELQGRAVIAVLLGILAIHVVQTIPVGGRLAQIASPIAWNFWETSGPGGSRPLTASVKETRDAILKFSACIAAFLIGVGLFSARKNARVLAACVFGTASVLGAYGLYVLLFRPATKLFGVPVYDWDRLSGVYTNANRFCGLLEMALPLGIALLLEGRSAAGRSSPDAGDGYPAHAAGRNGIASTKGIPQGGGRDAGWRDAILAFAVAFAALTLLLTRSRLGVISFLSGGSAAMWAAGGARASLRRAWPWLAFASVAAMAFTLAYGVEDATGRLAATGGDDLERRRSCWAATLTMILDHPMLGCGAGAFESLFPYYQPPGLRGYWNYAHSDWLSVPAELGLAGSALAATGIVLWLRAALPAAGKGGGWLPVGMLWGILAVLMHSLGDSPAMEPANAFLLFLLGGAVSGMAGRAASETVASGAGHPAVGGGRGGGGRT